MDTRVPLLLLRNDKLVWRWVDIEDSYLENELSNGFGEYKPANALSKRKPIVLNDLKVLYKMRAEDIDYITRLVESKFVSIKIAAVKKDHHHPRIISLTEAGR